MTFSEYAEAFKGHVISYVGAVRSTLADFVSTVPDAPVNVCKFVSDYADVPVLFVEENLKDSAAVLRFSFDMALQVSELGVILFDTYVSTLADIAVFNMQFRADLASFVLNVASLSFEDNDSFDSLSAGLYVCEGSVYVCDRETPAPVEPYSPSVPIDIDISLPRPPRGKYPRSGRILPRRIFRPSPNHSYLMPCIGSVYWIEDSPLFTGGVRLYYFSNILFGVLTYRGGRLPYKSDAIWKYRSSYGGADASPSFLASNEFSFRDGFYYLWMVSDEYIEGTTRLGSLCNYWVKGACRWEEHAWDYSTGKENGVIDSGEWIVSSYAPYAPEHLRGSSTEEFRYTIGGGQSSRMIFCSRFADFIRMGDASLDVDNSDKIAIPCSRFPLPSIGGYNYVQNFT